MIILKVNTIMLMELKGTNITWFANSFIISKSFTQFVSNLTSDIKEIHRRIIYMRKDLENKMQFIPLPVLMLATYDQDGKANVMNAAWGGVYDYNQVYVSLSKHKTTDNLELKKAFTLSFATKKTEKISDYFGVVSGNKEDKIAKSGVHITPSKHVDAPIIEEYPLTLECTVESFEDGNLIGNVVNVSIDEDYLDENGKIDVDKMEIIAFDMVNNTYRVLGENVGKAFKDGFDL